ncbi:MAG: DUF4369 domain-containing protein [Bacteroidales bacterium]|nr:DUF4369 domain-containing protein [Bacteroidales bacterium]
MKISKKAFYLILSSILFFSCNKQQTPKENAFILSGELSGEIPCQLILSEIGKTGFKSADTIVVDEKGKFSKTINLEEETLYSLSLKDDYITLCPKAKEIITIKAETSDFSGSYEVNGSQESQLLKEVNAHNSQVRKTLKSMSDYLKSNDINNLDSVKHVFIKRLQQMHAQELAYSENFIRKNKGSLTTLIVLYRTFEGRPLFDYRHDLTMHKETLDGLSKTLPNNQHTLSLKSFVEQKERENNERLAAENSK